MPLSSFYFYDIFFDGRRGEVEDSWNEWRGTFDFYLNFI